MAERSFAQSVADALDGVWHTLRHQRNFQIQIVLAAAACVAATLARFDAVRWAVLAVTIGVVLAAEIGNTALERAVDCASPQPSDAGRAAKHAGAGAVLVAALAAVGVGVALFGPVVWHR